MNESRKLVIRRTCVNRQCKQPKFRASSQQAVVCSRFLRITVKQYWSIDRFQAAPKASMSTHRINESLIKGALIVFSKPEAPVMALVRLGVSVKESSFKDPLLRIPVGTKDSKPIVMVLIEISFQIAPHNQRDGFFLWISRQITIGNRIDTAVGLP